MADHATRRSTRRGGSSGSSSLLVRNRAWLTHRDPLRVPGRVRCPPEDVPPLRGLRRDAGMVAPRGRERRELRRAGGGLLEALPLKVSRGGQAVLEDAVGEQDGPRHQRRRPEHGRASASYGRVSATTSTGTGRSAGYTQRTCGGWPIITSSPPRGWPRNPFTLEAETG